MTELSRRSLLVGTAAVGVAVAGTKTTMTPANAAAPVVGKQNAGWYRYKVGSFEVTVVNDGVTNAPLSDTYVANAQKDAVNTVLAADYMPKDRAVQLYTPLVVNSGSKLVAIDTGLSLGMVEQSKGAVWNYHANLQAAGIDRNAVDVVIISHFHADHINGLVGPENKPAFPSAEVIVSEAEWAFWADEGNSGRVPEQIKPTFANVKRVFGVLGNKVTRHEPGKELVPGITAISTPGHTPGHTSHVIASGDAKLLAQADVTAGMATLFVRNPEWQAWFDADKPLAVQTRRKIYDMASADKMLVQGFHFPFPSVGYIEKNGSGYRLVPAPWSPSI